MTVWCVFQYVEWEGNFIDSIHISKDAAETRLLENEEKYPSTDYRGWNIEEWEVEE